MQIVIEIPENVHYYITRTGTLGALEQDIVFAVKNGTPLPKGHGRLIDADELRETMYTCETNEMELYERLTIIGEAPTIIEADKGDSR